MMASAVSMSETVGGTIPRKPAEERMRPPSLVALFVRRSMEGRRHLRWLLLLLGVVPGCGRPDVGDARPTPLPAAAAVPLSRTQAMPTAYLEPAPTPAPALDESVVETNVIEVRVVTPTPVDVATIPNFDRPADPTPASRAEQRSRCLTYTVEPESTGPSTRLRVRVRSHCGFWVPVEESWFEIVATPVSGHGTTGRATGSFQAPIGPHSSNVETLVEVYCPTDVAGGCRYSVSAR